MPHALVIDGPDGCGKKTIVEMLRKRIAEQTHKNPLVAASPYYETNTGKAVKEYLTDGWGYWPSRDLATIAYSADRNMWMREHYSMMGISSPYADILFDRSWLSSVIIQSSVVAQSKGDQFRLRETRQEFPIRRDDAGVGCDVTVTISEMRDFFEHDDLVLSYDSDRERWRYIRDRPQKAQQELYAFYMNHRARIVRHMAKLTFDLEISPFRIVTENYENVPWTDGLDSLTNVVLCPHPKYAEKIIHENLMKRYKDHPEQADRNESNMKFQLGIVESILWMHKNWDFIATPAFYQMLPQGSFYYQYLPFNNVPYLDSSIVRANRFHIVYTTVKNTGELRPLEDICDDVFFYYMNERMHAEP